MKIRTRYKLFKIIIALAIITFIVSLWDIFGNDSAFFLPIMYTYFALAIIALLLYIGHKPNLDEEEPVIVAQPEPLPEQDVVADVTPPQQIDVKGPHNFRCPFCSNVFALELTHLQKRHETRMDCPFCANTIRIPARPKVAPGTPIEMSNVSADEQAVFVCSSCGEVLRYTAPGQRAEARARVHTCPHCGSDSVNPAAGAAA